MKTDQKVLEELTHFYDIFNTTRKEAIDNIRLIEEKVAQRDMDAIDDIRAEFMMFEALTIAQENTISGLIAHNTHMTRELEIIALEDIKFGDEPHSFTDKALKEAGIWK